MRIVRTQETPMAHSWNTRLDLTVFMYSILIFQTKAGERREQVVEKEKKIASFYLF